MENLIGIAAYFPFQVLMAVLCLFHALAGSAFAQTAVEPPRPWAINRSPSYPDERLVAENGEATVTLRVVVDRDGTVRDPRVVDGTEPFAGAALDAVKRWRYEPARDGTGAIAVPWQIRVRFELPPKAPDRWRVYRRVPSAGRRATADAIVASPSS